MISFMRIDDRLLHGQVVLRWVSTVHPDAIIVANDAVMNNPIQKSALKMAKPSGYKLSISSVDDAIKLINNPRAENMKLMVIVANTKEEKKIVENTKETGVLNIGGMRNKTPETKDYSKLLSMSDEDVDNIKSIYSFVKEVDTRMTPENSKKDFLSLVSDK